MDWIDDFVSKSNCDELVFLGDYFDSWGDTIADATKTANWLKWALDNYPNTTWLLGNHDMSYRFPWNTHLCCPGWTHLKNRAVNEILTQEDWAKFKLVHATQGFVCSHAGVLEDVFTHPINGLNISSIEAQCEEALVKAAAGIPCPTTSAGRDRGGLISLPGGGITWCDWNSLEPIPGFHQIVGHTIGDFVRTQHHPAGTNYCIDTNNRDIGIIEDGRFSHINNPSLNSDIRKK